MNNETNDSGRIASVLQRINTQLAAAGIEDPAADAELIVGHVLGESRGRVQTLALLDRELDETQLTEVARLSGDRADRVPLQHLTGRAPFRSIELSVGPGVFVPRPETETVVQIAIDALRAVPAAEPLAVDLCTGSGAIALSLAQELPTARVTAVEKSVEAHAWAQRNVAEWGDGRVELMLGDVSDLDPLTPRSSSALTARFAELAGRVNVLVSNPPYVPLGMVPRDPEVRDHDPDLALYSGEDGLDLVRVISRVARTLVMSGGQIVLEHAEQQGASIRQILQEDGWHSAATHQDLTGRDRATTAFA